MDSYQLGYRWVVEGPIATVFRYVSDARTFHEWFRVFEKVESDDPVGALKVGSHARCLVKALLPYRLDWDITVSRYEPPHLVETDCQVTLGGRFPMRGYVRYRFEQNGRLVSVVNEQELSSERPLPRLLHPLAQAIFSLNHDWAMSRARAPLQAVVRRSTGSLA
jgi:hypothetical protein